MRCEKCGKENQENANFCRYCGNPLQKNLNILVQRAKQNDQSALTEIYRYSSPAVYRTIKVLIKDDDTANDILQDTYIKAFARMDQLQHPDRLVPWLKMIANNTAKDWLKKTKPMLFSDISAGRESGELPFEEKIEYQNIQLNPEMEVDSKEVRRLVMEILDQLPEDQRMVIGMFYYEELSVKDIAVILGVSENTVKSRLVYGRKKIKEQVLDLEKRGTKLYTAAPFVFFLYLLRRMQSAPTDGTEMATLQRVMESGRYSASQYKASVDSKTAGNQTLPKSSAVSGKGSASSVSKAAAGTATKTVAKHAGVKIAAIILAGAAGVGGITYGVIRNADKLPFELPFAEKHMTVVHEDSASSDAGESSDVEETARATNAPESKDTQESQEGQSAGDEDAVDAETAYREFYEKYVADENLRVIENGLQLRYEYSEGYTENFLLSACMEDFGGDDIRELLLIRTTDSPVENAEEHFPTTKRKLQVELYGIDGQQVTLRQAVEIPDSNLNDSAAYITEQFALQKRGDAYYLYRYQWENGSTGKGSFENTFIKITDTELIKENTIYYSNYGKFRVNGVDYTNGATELDINRVNELLNPYGVVAEQELNGPCILNFNREEKIDGQLHWDDTFEVQNCFLASTNETAENSPEVDAPGMESGYYLTILNPNSDLKQRITAVEHDDVSITFYGSFYRTDELPFSSAVGTDFIEDGKWTFQLTSETQYYYAEADGKYPASKEEAIATCEKLNGLAVTLKVTDGRIETMTFSS